MGMKSIKKKEYILLGTGEIVQFSEYKERINKLIEKHILNTPSKEIIYQKPFQFQKEDHSLSPPKLVLLP